MHRNQRRAGRFLVPLCGVVITLGGVAFACTNLASINLSSSAGKVGDAIVVTGSGFSGGVEGPMDGMDMGSMDMGGTMESTSGLATRSPVVLRWNGPEGPVLTSAIPDRTGSISVTFNIPESQPGHYTLVAVQKNPQGYDVYGTPARASIEVTLDGRPTPRGATAAPQGGSSQLSSTGLIVLTVTLGVTSLGLLIAGAIATSRQVGRRRVPATVTTTRHPQD